MNTFNIGEDYILPSWSSKPTLKYFLEIIKDGVPIGEKDISYKPFILLGKYPDLCDVVMEHPTVSRKHAIIQHKNNGEIFLYDLKSSHGTFVNNKQLPSRVYHQLHPFDSLRFANSTRTYILRCLELEEKDQEEQLREEAEMIAKNKNNDAGQNKKKDQSQGGNGNASGSKEVLGDDRIRTPKEMKDIYIKLRDNDPYYKHQNKSRKLKGGPAQTEEEKALKENSDQNPGDGGISWGMSDEQEVYDYHDENQIALIPDLLRRLPNLNEKQIEKIEKYEEKLAKYNTSEQEMEQLTTKERKEFGLEEKLKERKEKLQVKLLEVQQNLDQAESNVRLSLFGECGEESEELRRKKAAAKFDNNIFGDEDDDEEYFDRSKSKKLKIDHEERKKIALGKLENTTANYWGLKQKLEKLMAERHDLNSQVLGLNEKKDGDVQENQEEDELDAFMKETDAKLDKENRDKLFGKIRELNTEIQLVSDMLQYIKPDTEIDYESFEKKLDSNKAFQKDNDEDDDDDNQGLVRQAATKNSILKEENKKPNRIASELEKLREIKKIRQEKLEKNNKDEDKEMNEDQIMKQAQEELKRQKNQRKSFQEEYLSKFQEEHANDGEDAPLYIAPSEIQQPDKKVYKVAAKPASRNVKTTKDQEACVDLTYMQSMEDCTEVYNEAMSKKFGY